MGQNSALSMQKCTVVWKKVHRRCELFPVCRTCSFDTFLFVYLFFLTQNTIYSVPWPFLHIFFLFYFNNVLYLPHYTPSTSLVYQKFLSVWYFFQGPQYVLFPFLPRVLARANKDNWAQSYFFNAARAEKEQQFIKPRREHHIQTRRHYSVYFIAKGSINPKTQQQKQR